MDLMIFILTLVAAGISLAGAALSVWNSRKNSVTELKNDVEDIISVVERIAKESRSAKMRRVREAAADTDIPKPPGLVESQPTAPVTDKAALRRMAFGGRQQ